MKKSILKILGFVLLFVLILLIAVPFFLEGKIQQLIKDNVNNSINATLDFSDAKLSLIKNFPNAHVRVKDISLVNMAPFDGDTLFSAREVALNMSVMELFKGAGEPMGIKNVQVAGARLDIKVDSSGNANYDIAKESGEPMAGPTTEPVGESGGFSLELDSYAISDSEVRYHDLGSGMRLLIEEMNHSGSGDLSLEQSQLETLTDALVSFEMDSTQYLSRNKVSLDALIGVDLVENKYSFLENKALINQLPLVFDGFVKINEDDQEVDISFKTPSSDFKNFLAVIPEAYAANLDQVQTTGNFELSGYFKGIVDQEHIPTFNIKVNSDNASFKFPDLPKTVRNVHIAMEVDNATGITEDTAVDIERLSFNIDQDHFNLKAKIRELMGNTQVSAHLAGKIDLASISEAYPLPEDYGLKGLLDADVNTSFDMGSLENKQYQNTQLVGHLKLSGFEYASEELKHPVAIAVADLGFDPGAVKLNAFQGTMGSSDFKITGSLANLLGFMFNGEQVRGQFQLSSNRFDLSDMMMEEAQGEKGGGTDAPVEVADAPVSTADERIKIPSFLDCTLEAMAKTVVYDNLQLKNVRGTLIIKDETATLQNLTSDLFGGSLGVSGMVSTKEPESNFDLNLAMDNFNIEESFAGLELFAVLTPLAQALEGKLNTDINISGLLKDDLSLDLMTISGNLLAELLSPRVDAQNAPLLGALDSKLNFLDSKAIDLDGLKTSLSFDNGAVHVKPFDLKYKDIAIHVDGSHSFDRQLAYSATLQVPAKYLGSEVSGLIVQLNDQSLEEVTVPVKVSIGGNYTNPQVNTDLGSAVKDLTAKLVEVQKQQLMAKGQEKAKDLLSGLLDKDGSDSTQTGAGGGVKEALGNLLGGEKKTDTDTSKAQKGDQGREAAKSILGGLLGKKKKDTVD